MAVHGPSSRGSLCQQKEPPPTGPNTRASADRNVFHGISREKSPETESGMEIQVADIPARSGQAIILAIFLNTHVREDIMYNNR